MGDKTKDKVFAKHLTFLLYTPTRLNIMTTDTDYLSK